MTLMAEYRSARRGEDVARLRRVLALRALVASGRSQRRIAEELGITQSAVSQQLKAAPVGDAHPATLIDAAAPVLRALAAQQGFRRLAVFGSVARGTAHADSDIDLIVQSPPEASTFDLLRFKALVEQVLGRGVDMIDYGGLSPDIDGDILRDAVLL